MADLRKELVKLAREIPETRRHLVSLLRDASYNPGPQWQATEKGTFLNPHVKSHQSSSQGGAIDHALSIAADRKTDMFVLLTNRGYQIATKRSEIPHGHTHYQISPAGKVTLWKYLFE
ncbi:MAG: hypothetical protein WC824_07865 [Bacteroidota bacterium]